jgi:hypothetical protein
MSKLKYFIIVPWVLSVALCYLISCVICVFYIAIKENLAKIK